MNGGDPAHPGDSRRSPGRRRAGVLAASVLALVAVPALAGDLEIVSKLSWESGGQRFIQPCVRNKSATPREARFRIGTGSVFWAFKPLPVEAGKVVCFTLDSPVIAKGLENQLELE